MAENPLFSQKWLKIHGSRLQNMKLQIVSPKNDILQYFLGLFLPPNIFFHTFVRETWVGSWTLS